MKAKISAIIIIAVALCALAQTQPQAVIATGTWNAAVAGMPITNYAMYWGPASGVYTNHVDAGTNLTAVVPGLLRGVAYYFVVNATDSLGRTGPNSLEAMGLLTALPGAPGSFKISIGP